MHSLGIDEKFVQRETDSVYINSHTFYLNIFYWLAPAFSNIKKEILQRLALAGYTYFRSALLFDTIMDAPLNDKKQLIELLMLGLSYHECAVKELGIVFPDDDHFWKKFDVIKKKYTQANLLEKQLSKEKQVIDRQLFKQIAQGKSYLSVASVLTLCSVVHDFTHYEALKESLLSFHTGYQLFDDIDDFARDLAGNQKTYAICRVEEFVRNNIRADGEITDDEKKKYLYISGIAEELLGDAKANFEKSLEKIEELPLDEFKQVIQSEMAKCEKLRWEIDQTLKKTRVKANRSQSYRKQIPDASLHDEVILSLENSVSFLESSLEEEAVWSDFLTNAGVSTGWVTGYIGFHLSEAGLGGEMVTKVVHQIKNKLTSFGSFNETIIRDADSLTFAIGFLSHYAPEAAVNLVDSWLPYQQAGGGWVTYKDPDQLKQKLSLPETQHVSGWTTPHPCVSATAALIMKKLPQLNRSRRKTLNYLAGCQTKEGYIPSYWWTSPVYATSYAAIAFGKEKKWDKNKALCIHWLLDRQQPNGAWDTGYKPGGNSAFYTALALKTLLHQSTITNQSLYHDEIQKGIQWLVENQMSDGSWKTQRVLRIPSTEIENPDEVATWRRSSFGVNTVIDDHYRNFTTAAVCSALADFETFLAMHKIQKPFFSTDGGE